MGSLKRRGEYNDEVEIGELSVVDRLFETMCGRLRERFGYGLWYDRMRVVDKKVWKYEFGWEEWSVLVELTKIAENDWKVDCVANTKFWRVPLVSYRFVVEGMRNTNDRIDVNLNKVEVSLCNYLLDGK